jgi:DNA helicase INO80
LCAAEDVESEMAEKIELEVPCSLTPRQKKMYNSIKENITFAELLENYHANTENSMKRLMNYVMQLRKVQPLPLFWSSESQPHFFFVVVVVVFVL